MACNRTCTCPHAPAFIQACYCRKCKIFNDELKNLFYSFSSVLIINSLLMFFSQKIHKMYTSIAFTYFFCLPLLFPYVCLGDRNKNQLRKDFCQIKNKETHCLHILAQQTNKLRLRESFRTGTRSSCLVFISLNIPPTYLLSKTSL